MNGKTIESVLVEAGILTEQKAKEYSAQSQEKNVSFEEYVRAQNLVSERDIAFGYAQLYQMPFIETITEKEADPELMARVPLRFLRDNAVTPLKKGQEVIIVLAQPYNMAIFDEMGLIFPESHSFAIAPRNIIIEVINKYYPLEGVQKVMEKLEEEGAREELTLESIGEEDLMGGADEAPIIKIVNQIIYQAAKLAASDIHIEPFEKEVRVRYRIDGIMHLAFTPPKRTQGALTARLKIMANLNIAEKRLPQDGRIAVKVADRPIDIRVSVLPTSFGERIAMRLLDKTRSFVSLEKLGFSERDYRVIRQSIEQPNGIVLVTGPTGSGKTSTLYSVLYELNTPDVNVITVEDPVEYQMAGIGQVQVREKVGLTFAAALRSILRQDPDIVMIGETRDPETAQIAIQAALTGHLVLSTLHTNSAAASVTRLIDMGTEPFLIASTLVSVMAQRLVRRLCLKCREAYEPTPEALKRIGISAAEAKKTKLYRAKGCEECSQTGFKGRVALFEIMVMTPAIAKLTLERADTNVIQQQAIKDGMTLLVVDGARKVMLGLTTIEEVLMVAESQEGID